ncbi:MAG: PEP-CTERM sorting domain-containing protein [Acidobacteria bacterium]|nr:PEP-CTERM sorting domain-containing protein [Acidobacteriota bacterium]
MGRYTGFTGNGEFQAEIPEPATMLLLGTGLTGIAISCAKSLRSIRVAQADVAGPRRSTKTSNIVTKST